MQKPVVQQHALPELQFDPARMALGSQGLESFYWPVAFDELIRVRDDFLVRLFGWIRAEGVDRSRDAELVWLNALQITVEVMRLFNGHALQRRSAGYVCLAPDGATLFHALAEERLPGQSEHLRRTLAGVPADPAWRKALRTLKSNLDRNSLAYLPRQLIRPRSHIVTFSATPLTLAHAKTSDAPVVISKISEWMSAGAVPDGFAKSCSEVGLKSVVDCAREAFEQGGEQMPEIVESQLSETVLQLCRRTAFHLEELERQGERLPRIFWSGTGGILNNRVMARAVGKLGGRAVGHDHGTGSGWWDTCYQTLSELNYFDRFVTFSPGIAEGLRGNLRSEFLAYPDRPCRIESLPENAGRVPKATRNDSQKPKTAVSPGSKTVMYVPTMYLGDSMHFQPLLPDAVAVDWQARLLAFLRAAGHEIVIKPHPESGYPIPPAFTDLFDAKLVEGPFEAVMRKADLLLFDYLQTSCIVDAVRSDMPIVLVEFPRLALKPEARDLLGRRAALVKGWFDSDSRAQIDWAGLRSALAQAPVLNDRSFAETYYP